MNQYKVSLILVTTIFLVSMLQAKQERIPLYIGYTPSHQILVDDWFKAYLTDPNIELRETRWEQRCQSANFYNDGWAETVVRKFDLLIKATQENWGKAFIYSDVDVQTFGIFANRAIECLGDMDVIFQRETPYGVACTGFIVARANERTLRLWQEGKQILSSGQSPGDQIAVNMVLQNKSIAGLKWGYLPWQEFYGPGIQMINRVWEPGTSLHVPAKTIRVHHANYTIGIERKIAQLKLFRKAVETAQQSSDYDAQGIKVYETN